MSRGSADMRCLQEMQFSQWLLVVLAVDGYTSIPFTYPDPTEHDSVGPSTGKSSAGILMGSAIQSMAFGGTRGRWNIPTSSSPPFDPIEQDSIGPLMGEDSIDR